MKKTFVIILILFCTSAFAQDSLKYYNNLRINTTSSGMKVLGVWGAVNLGTGAIWGWNNKGTTTYTNLGGTQVTSSKGVSREGQYFFQMNTIWGAVDFGTALLGYASVQKYRKKNLTAAETLEQQKKLEKIFLINGALDIAYLGTGTYLKLVGDSRHSPIMRGYGESILMQGGFLLIFDGFMYHAEKHNGTKLRNFLEKHPISFDGHRIGTVITM
ncbi:hypothetical protein [Mucilaginibacter sp. BT774]|uniref:DUF6992 family protein n=1 Tax=Mucilaginibacter sp. BT774 TaxID=3062276 RepID=UPI002675682A|nr:hypothetical protein [Mucilaginibacter sp. BT774]MDO3627717.1 hypothetical protein [Mucilaginibacter sp. BT774]